MIYVLSDGSLNSNSMVDSQRRRARQARLAGRQLERRVDLLPGVQPQGPPGAANGAAGPADRLLQRRRLGGDQLEPRGNSVKQLVQLVILNYMGLLGTDSQFTSLFPMQGLGPASAAGALTAFQPIV